jgi:MFS family permease
MGARVAENGAFYVFTVFVLSYATEKLKMPARDALTALLFASAMQFLAIPLFGRLSDSVGRRPVYLSGALAVAAFAFPFFWMLDQRWVGLALSIALVAQSAMYAPQAAFFSELFGTDVRYTGASIGYQLASPLAGGLAPLICEYLLHRFDGRSGPIAVYLIALSTITLISVWLAAETHRTRLEDGDE